MLDICNMRSEDLERIKVCALVAIVACFNYYGFKYTEYDLDEVLGETYLRICKSHKNYDENRSKKGWFKKIACNCACDYMNKLTQWRTHHHLIEMKPANNDGDEYEPEYSYVECSECYHADRDLESKENVKILKGVFDSLGEVAGKALWLQANGYDSKDIYECFLHKSNGSVRTAMTRGRVQFKNDPEVIQMVEELLGIKLYSEAS